MALLACFDLGLQLLLLLQQGLNYYNEEQSKTTFHTQEAINAFDTWTKFYTTYSFEQQYDAFTRFRTGDMPILIQNYSFFIPSLSYVTCTECVVKNFFNECNKHFN